MPRRDLIFRVFVSSTFSDLKVERNALQENTFPALREYCRKRGARFQAIDLRWGVSQEAALDQQAMGICLDELARCQQVSPRPNFIVLLGDRYGWRPLPARVQAALFEELLDRVSAADRPLLAGNAPVAPWRAGGPVDRVGWYRRDENAVPPEYVLQSRSIDYPPGASEQEKKDMREQERQDWAEQEARMRENLLAAIESLGWPADDPRRFVFEASATHQEIRAGALEADQPQEHVFCYFREIAGLPEDATAARYRDIQDGAPDPDARRRLDALKKSIEYLPVARLHRYPARWKDQRPDYDIATLCNDVEKDLMESVDREIARFRQQPGPEREKEAHREFAKERCRHFKGRVEILQRISAYIASDDPSPLVIYGGSGSGKTALMARASLDCAGEAGHTVVSQFIGATPGSSDLRLLLGDLCRELGVSEVPQDMNELVRTFRSLLSPSGPAAEGKGAGIQQDMPPGGTVLFLDALDQLNPTDNARMLYWMPRELRPGVRMVVSVLKDGGGPEAPSLARPAVGENPFDIARRIWPQSLVRVGDLDGHSGAALLDAWLAEGARTLTPDQSAGALSLFSRCPYPLFLRLLSHQARRVRSWEHFPGKMPGSVEGVLETLLESLEQPDRHGALVIRRALGYMTAAKNGLTEDELVDLLSRRESGVLDDFRRRSPESPPVDRLPFIVWSRLFDDIGAYMTVRRADGTMVMDFYHRQVGEAARRRYLAGEPELVETHLHLADYFDSLNFWVESLEAQRARARRLPPTPRPANVRKVVELPFHRLEVAKLAGRDDAKSPYWDAVADLLTNWEFLEAKAEADPYFEEQEASEPHAVDKEEGL